ncbi:hypothetical protein [Arthrobacter sp. M4]|uniref:hypothetical protein n=1 Tax=Arthrobacter sp. M4 TaxID=218160 RepID=UPI001CDD39A0|nr:hypothetical protein [Arthrobacter sp. M4]MCA4134535.1 hypothetical protein [Arthrobacter sp. M4]
MGQADVSHPPSASAAAQGDATRLETCPPVALFDTEEGDRHATGDVYLHESDEVPNTPPRISVDGLA